MTSNNPWNKINTDSNINSIKIANLEPFDIYWAIGSGGSKELWIKYSTKDGWPRSIILDGITITPYQLPDDNFRLVISLQDSSLTEVFYLLCNNLVRTIPKGGISEKGMLKVVYNRLQRWKKFFSEKKVKMMSRSAQIGLLGELYFFDKVLIPHSDENNICDLWKGPTGGNQDFVFGNFAVEVKTTTQSANATIQISSLEQLDITKLDVFLYVATISSSKQKEKAISLNSYVRSINEKLTNNESKISFNELLEEVGYLPLEIYDENWFEVIDTEVFEVVNDFPGITEDLVGSNIESLEYKIALKNCKAYTIPHTSLIERVSND
jgi:hypothetical protein